MKSRILSTFLIPWLVFLATSAPAAPAMDPRITQGIDDDAKLPYWEWQGDGLSLRLVQRLPDQTRAFFQARGFSAEDAELFARACVFQSIIRNTAEPGSRHELLLDLNLWRVRAQEKEQPLLLREYWANEWAKREVGKPARIAFEWALFPSKQRYAPGDYNWGMTAYGLGFGERFDLAFSWQLNGVKHQAVLPGMTCAPDIHPENTP